MNQQQLDALVPLAHAVRRLFHKFAHGVDALHAGTGITAGMRAVLESVIDGGPQTVPQMARVRPVTRQHIQTLVNALLEGGYVEMVDNVSHKRSRLVCPTKKGEQAFLAMRKIEDAAFRRLRIEVAPDELAAATATLRALISVFEGREWRSIVDRLTANRESKYD